MHPLQGLHRILYRRWVRFLWTEAIIDRHNHTLCT